MSTKTITWDGNNAIDIASFLPHHNFTHKAGTLFIEVGNGTISIDKGEVLTKSSCGEIAILVETL